MTRIDEIKARCDKATPGPWDDKVTAVYKDNTAIRICGQFYNFDADAFFIAQARDDIPYLLAELDRITAKRDAIKLEYEAIAEMHISAVECWRKAEAERDEWKRKCEAAVEDFVDYATSGTINPAPYCVNKTKLCTDARGWCNHDKNCKGFYPNSGAEQEEA